jgi:hypothetical protein
MGAGHARLRYEHLAVTRDGGLEGGQPVDELTGGAEQCRHLRRGLDALGQHLGPGSPPPARPRSPGRLLMCNPAKATQHLPVEWVQGRLGHATAAETLDAYWHLWPDSDDRYREAVDAAHGNLADSLRTEGVIN